MLADLSTPAPALQSPSRPFHSPLVPAILGTWQAGQIMAVDRQTGQMHVDRSPINPDLSDNSLMPYGQQLELTSGYDKAAQVAYWQIRWLTPFPANACQFPFLQFHCTEIKGVSQPRQEPMRLEYTMSVSQEDIESFFPVGATKTGRVYYLRCGGNDEWVPELYVSKDRQRMWISASVDSYEKYYGLQEYHRVAEYKPR